MLKTKPDDLLLPGHACDPANPPGGLDSEEVRIFRQSLPAEEVTRDFLQELLAEHQASRERETS